MLRWKGGRRRAGWLHHKQDACTARGADGNVGERLRGIRGNVGERLG